MRGFPPLRWAVLGLALSGLTAVAQTTPRPPTSTPARPETAPAPRPASPAISPTLVAATVNGESIYEIAVQRSLERYQPARRAEVRSDLVNHLIDNLLIDQSLRAANYTVDAKDVESHINEMKTELKKRNQDFEKMLAGYKVTEAELRQHITTDLRWFKYAEAQINDKALRNLFEKNKDMFDGSAVLGWHILMTTHGDEKSSANVQAQLVQIKKSIESEVAAGLAKEPSGDKLAMEKKRGTLVCEVFARYAKEKSECPSKTRGGFVNWFRKVGFMTPTFSDAAFALQPYQISDPVKTPFGYHLIMISERRPGKDVKFEDVKEVVKEVYLERLHDSLASQLRQRAKIVVNPPPQ
jgi:peptidyl-prolyl cis-trans isomerase C